MKKKHLFLFAWLLTLSLPGLAQQDTGYWITRSSFSSSGLARTYMGHFAINEQVHVIGGSMNNSPYNGLGRHWVYDASTDSWTQLSNFPGIPRKGGGGFSIGQKGYYGGGIDSANTPRNDFWEYRWYTNTWVQKANLPGFYKNCMFTIGAKGYLINQKNVYEYDTTANGWTLKTVYPGSGVYALTAFTINTNVYVGLGTQNTTSTSTHYKDFWEYNSASNSWVQKSDFPGVARHSASGFAHSGKGYVGFGGNCGVECHYSTVNKYPDLYIFNPQTNTWTQKKVYMTSPFYAGVAVVTASGRVFLGLGEGANNKFFEYFPNAPSPWTKKSIFPGVSRFKGICFTIDQKGYFGLGNGPSSAYDYKDFWEYDQATDTWTQKADYAGGEREAPFAFAIGTKGYVGGGRNSSPGYFKDFWEYNPASNTWTQKADFGGGVRDDAVAFVIGNDAYVGTGSSFVNSQFTYHNDFWKYNPVSNTWSAVASLPASPRDFAIGTSIGNKGYVGFGNNGSSLTDFWEYNPVINTWVLKASPSSTFSFGGKAPLISSGGSAFIHLYGLYEYVQLTNTWIKRADYPDSGFTAYCSFNFGKSVYLGIGIGSYVSSNTRYNSFWEYNPLVERRIIINGVSANQLCRGDSMMVFFNNNTGSTTTVTIKIFNSYAAGYSLTTLGSKTSAPGVDSIKVRIPLTLSPASGYSVVAVSGADMSNTSDVFTLVGAVSAINGSTQKGMCIGDSVVLSASVATGHTYQWLNSAGNIIAGATNTSFTANTPDSYRVITKHAALGCVDTSAFCVVTHFPSIKANFTANDSGQCLIGNTFTFTDSSLLTSGTFTSKWNFGEGVTDTSSFINPNKIYTAPGLYNIQLNVTTNNGCKDSVSKMVRVHPQPKAGFSITHNDTQCINNNSFLFQDTSVGGLTRIWNLGTSGNDTSSLANPVKSYSNTTSYQISLIAISAFACRDTTTKQILIQPKPTAAFTTDSTQCKNGNRFVMSNGSSGLVNAIHWSLGNGNTSTLVNPAVSYPDTGLYTIRLVVQNIYGCNDTMQKIVKVKPNPSIPMVLADPDTIACDLNPIVLRTLASPFLYEWKKTGSTGVLSTADTVFITSTLAGLHYLRITDLITMCPAYSDTLNISFKPSPPKPIVTLAGNVLTSSASTGNQWHNTSGIIAGQTAQTFTATSVGQYYTIITVNGCASPASDLVNFPATGIQAPVAENGISVYPNPNNGSFTIVLNQKTNEPVLVKMFDFTGRLVWSEVKTGNELHMQAANLASGSYLVEVISNYQVQRIRIAINR